MKIKGMGQTTFDKIISALTKLNLRLGMTQREIEAFCAKENAEHAQTEINEKMSCAVSEEQENLYTKIKKGILKVRECQQLLTAAQMDLHLAVSKRIARSKPEELSEVVERIRQLVSIIK